jgi:murein DD-endopeptidase MepM/ murein hydrolase activator NlpD
MTLFASMTMTLAAALQAAPATPPPPVPALELGRQLTAAFYRGDLDGVWARFSDPMRQAISSVEALRALRAQVEAQAGGEEAVLEEKVEAKDGFQIYLRIARFSKAPVRLAVQWTLGVDGSVQGFFIRPVPEEPAREQLDYATRTELRLPFTGSWYVFWGGRTSAENYHFTTVDQRFAYDLIVRRDGRSHAGEGKRNEDYYCFDQQVVAPAAGTVVSVEADVADNVPGVMNPKQPMGNHVVLDHGNGEFSVLCHFRQGTVAVKRDAKVQAGDPLGRCGNSGNSSEPHLHYHLQDSPEFGKGRGLPAPFRGYRADGKLVDRGEPVKGQTIEAP